MIPFSTAIFGLSYFILPRRLVPPKHCEGGSETKAKAEIPAGRLKFVCLIVANAYDCMQLI